MPETLIPFVGAAILIAMTPGPSTVVIVRESVTSGRRVGLAAVLGNETGVLAWGLAAALGLTALLAASEFAYDAMRIIGAVVLVWFGARGLWQTRRRGIVPRQAAGADTAGTADIPEVPVPVPGPGAAEPDGGAASRGRLWRAYRLGVVTNAANPKAGVFALSFLPQFVPEGAPVPVLLVALSALWVLIDTIWYFGLVWLVGRARTALASARVRRRLEQVSGMVLIGLGVRLAADAR